MTDEWRKVAEQIVAKLKNAVFPLPSAAERGEKFKILSKMLMVSPSADKSDEGTVAKVSVYLDDALNDLPAWTVAGALRRWHRGECGSDFNYTFAPAPGVLRSIALKELEPAKLVLRQLNLVLIAAPSAAEAEKTASAPSGKAEIPRRLQGGGGNRNIRVEHVHVHEGGKAILGAVTAPGGHGLT